MSSPNWPQNGLFMDWEFSANGSPVKHGGDFKTGNCFIASLPRAVNAANCGPAQAGHLRSQKFLLLTGFGLGVVEDVVWHRIDRAECIQHRLLRGKIASLAAPLTSPDALPLSQAGLGLALAAGGCAPKIFIAGTSIMHQCSQLLSARCPVLFQRLWIQLGAHLIPQLSHVCGTKHVIDLLLLCDPVWIDTYIVAYIYVCI